jgi:hypothetical protein
MLGCWQWEGKKGLKLDCEIHVGVEGLRGFLWGFEEGFLGEVRVWLMEGFVEMILNRFLMMSALV